MGVKWLRPVLQEIPRRMHDIVGQA